MLTEDTSKHAGDIVHALARRIAARAMHLPRFEREAEHPAGSLKDVVGACAWKRTQHSIALARELATRLKTGEQVVFHHDGDSVWSKRKRGGTAAEFEEKVLKRMKNLLGEDWEKLSKNLLMFVPYYSIESWLYLNTAVIERLVEEGRLQGELIPQIKAWLDEHGCLDEVHQLDKTRWVRKDHNHHLVPDFPAEKAEALSPSFKATVSAWQGCL